MIEFDVLPQRPDGTGELVLAHDYRATRGGTPPRLEEGLAHFAGAAFDGIELDVDLKLPGYEERVVEALRKHDLIDRCLVSSQYTESLARIRALESGLRLGWSVPKLRRDYTSSPFTVGPALAVLLAYRRALPARAGRALREGRVDAIMAHWRLITARLVRDVELAGGSLFVWTVDDLAHMRTLDALGVTGVITNDPRLFASLS